MPRVGWGEAGSALVVLLAALWVGGCDCHGVALEGDATGPDATSDVEVDAEEAVDDGGAPEDEGAEDAPEAIEDAGRDTGPPCLIDNDDDGYPSFECGGPDCDDEDPTVHPGAPDECGDSIDSDCDGLDPMAAGLLGDPALLVDQPPTGYSIYSELLWTGTEYLVVWRMGGLESVRMIRLDVGGRRIGDEVAMRDNVTAFDAAWSGAVLGAAWSAPTADPDENEIWFQSYDREGSSRIAPVRLFGGPGVWLGAGSTLGPRVVSTDGDFLVVWGESGRDGTTHRVLLARISPDGVSRFEPMIVASSTRDSMVGVDARWAEGELAILWAAPGRFPPPLGRPAELWLERTSGWGAPLGHSVVTNAASGAPSYQLVDGGAEIAAFWSAETESGDFAVGFSRLDADGEEILSGLLTPLPDPRFPEHRPFVATGTHFVSLWPEQLPTALQVTLRRFDRTGALDGPEFTIPAAPWPNNPDIVWTGSEFGFIWSEGGGRPDEGNMRIWFQRATYCD